MFRALYAGGGGGGGTGVYDKETLTVSHQIVSSFKMHESGSKSFSIKGSFTQHKFTLLNAKVMNICPY